uniref:Orf149 n=1 Tax=Monoblepharella sp. JEL15 TaxID=224130 RepID=Q85MB4_9FUNG|nr:orf149 [Monoblepharella sp. JEL15]AAO64968.1 orf149 [Monoblepharella sp. JEL15]
MLVNQSNNILLIPKLLFSLVLFTNYGIDGTPKLFTMVKLVALLKFYLMTLLLCFLNVLKNNLRLFLIKMGYLDSFRIKGKANERNRLTKGDIYTRKSEGFPRWIMDDGYWDNDSSTICLSTESFTSSEVTQLRQLLAKYDLKRVLKPCY